jgi:hypothetical protein
MMHEHGHGIGLRHVYPINNTKLMEPGIDDQLDGPQEDDIRGTQRVYGDDSQANDDSANAADTGSLADGPIHLADRSIESTGMNDYFKFFAPDGSDVSITLTPIGTIYPMGESAATVADVDALRIHDLAFQVLGTNGSFVAAMVNNTGPGESETLNDFHLGAEGTYFARVYSVAGADDVQRYALDIDGDIQITSMQIVDHVLKRATLSPAMQTVADANQNGAVDVGDLIINVINP